MFLLATWAYCKLKNHNTERMKDLMVLPLFGDAMLAPGYVELILSTFGL